MPLLWLSLAFLTGILLAANLHLPGYAWLGLAGLALVIGLIGYFWRRRSNTPLLSGRWSLLTDNFLLLLFPPPSPSLFTYPLIPVPGRGALPVCSTQSKRAGFHCSLQRQR